jgi:hypothetical protein
MANEEHVKILKQGVNVRNKWREENPDVKPDLSKAKLKDILYFLSVSFFYALHYQQP